MFRLSLLHFFFKGVFLGHLRRITKFSVGSYLLGFRKNVVIFDLVQTLFHFRRALFFMRKILLFRGKVLFVGGSSIYEKFFIRYLNHLFVARWSGGLLSNRFCFPGYRLISRRLPSCIFLSNTRGSNFWAVNEFDKLSKVPFIVVLDSDFDISLRSRAWFPIYGNNRVFGVINFYEHLISYCVVRFALEEHFRFKFFIVNLSFLIKKGYYNLDKFFDKRFFFLCDYSFSFIKFYNNLKLKYEIDVNAKYLQWFISSFCFNMINVGQKENFKYLKSMNVYLELLRLDFLNWKPSGRMFDYEFLYYKFF